ncbi:hypothetical protein [Lentilactobacillus sp. SPB1-3]|uniref:Uncharacterized protein n=1 Tax=Lentilactobacillus terminaliae TaxID=3003483 RepID=A0ACD5DH79_9LACO|nr:hypothetical protein [Lentilactobacillus sp. SPB1-3]MCZ0976967.1 hypothetical protein [Lentilactobacillus sp. SPB1-3]
MNTKIASILATGLAALGLGILVNQNTVHASNGYSVVKSSWPAGYGTVYHAKSFSNNAYVWTHLNHKEKAANLKNYPNSSWASLGTIILKHNGKNSVYYAISNVSPVSKKSVTGYVWSGYLANGYNPNFSKVNTIELHNASNTDYNRFIKQSPSQELTRQVLSLFPNSKVDVKASIYSLYQDDANKPSGNVLNFKDVNKYLNSLNNKTTSQRVSDIKSMLLKHNVDLNANYTIGIRLTNFTFRKNIEDQQQGLVLIEN